MTVDLGDLAIVPHLGAIELIKTHLFAIGHAHILAFDTVVACLTISHPNLLTISAVVAGLTIGDADLLPVGAVVMRLLRDPLGLPLGARAMAFAALSDSLGSHMLLLTFRSLRAIGALHAHALLAFGPLWTLRTSLVALGSLSTLATASTLRLSGMPTAVVVWLGGRRG